MENDERCCGYIDTFATEFIKKDAEQNKTNLEFIENCNECLPLLKFIAKKLENQGRGWINYSPLYDRDRDYGRQIGF